MNILARIILLLILCIGSASSVWAKAVPAPQAKVLEGVKYNGISYLSDKSMPYRPGVVQESWREKDEPYAKHVAKKDKVVLPYRLYSPERLEKGKKYPMVIFLHGMGRSQGLDNKAHFGSFAIGARNYMKKNGFEAYVMIPQCRHGYFWFQSPEIKYKQNPSAITPITVLLDEIERMSKDKKYQLDSDRIAVAGYSMGGIATTHLMANATDVFCAFAPMAGANYGNNLDFKKLSKKPIWTFVGKKDTRVNPAGAMDIHHQLVKKYKSKLARITVYDEGHGIFPYVMHRGDFYEWLFTQSKNGPLKKHGSMAKK